MKWSRSEEMKESFNCITHPHFTSCGKQWRSSAGMDVVTNRWRTMLLQTAVYWMAHMVLSGPHSLRHPQIHILHTKCVFSNFKWPEDNQCSFIVSNPAKAPLAVARVQKSATHSKTKLSADTDSCHLLSVAPKYKADSEMPPCDFLEELIYSI